MGAKALARFLYANVYGIAPLRFALKDAAAGYFPKPEFHGVPHIVTGSKLIVDIGANRGQSIQAFKRLLPKSRIVAFEPEPRSAARLQRRYRNDPNTLIHACALGSSIGSLAFFVPKYGHWDCDGMSATDYKEATDWLRDPGRMLFFDEKRLSVHQEAVACNTLDSFALAPSLIKLHAQGAELHILLGAQRTVERHTPALMVAFPLPDTDALLTEWGYRAYRFQNGYFEVGRADSGRTFTWYLLQQHVSKLPLRDVSTMRPIP